MYEKRWHSRDEPPEIISSEPFWCAVCNEIYDKEDEQEREIDGKRVCPECFDNAQPKEEEAEDEE